MAPARFDDIPKVATTVLNDDYQVSGYVLKARQKTRWAGAVLNTQIDLFADNKCATPAKLAWRLPAPLGLGFLNIDKLEMDKGGKYRLEASSDKAHPGLRLECKSDLADVSKVVAACSYTGLKNAQFKFECKAAKPQDFTAEATYSMGVATCGLKFNGSVLAGGLPDFGVRLLSGPMFCSLLVKDRLDTLSAAASYRCHPDVKCAAAYNFAVKKASGNLAVAVAYKGLYKVKVSQDRSVCCSVKHTVAKGFSLLGGLRYSGKGVTCGLQLSLD